MSVSQLIWNTKKSSSQSQILDLLVYIWCLQNNTPQAYKTKHAQARKGKGGIITAREKKNKKKYRNYKHTL